MTVHAWLMSAWSHQVRFFRAKVPHRWRLPLMAISFGLGGAVAALLTGHGPGGAEVTALESAFVPALLAFLDWGITDRT